MLVMKKALLLLILILVIGTIYIYILLPPTEKVSETIPVSATLTNTTAFLGDQNKWVQWWPFDTIADPGSHIKRFACNGYAYHISRTLHGVIEIDISKGTERIKSSIVLTPHAVDSVELNWNTIFTKTSNPILRVQHNTMAKNLKECTREILEALATYLKEERNIYGINIITTRVTDTLLAVSTKSFKAVPSTSAIYKMISDLESEIIRSRGKVTGYPMLNLNDDSTSNEVMVALPVEKTVAGGKLIYKKMVPGKILMTEIRGGPQNIQYGYLQLRKYYDDHRLESPAIPFQSLITNRSTEVDTSKWITRLYYPIF